MFCLCWLSHEIYPHQTQKSPPKGTSVAHRRSSMRGWTFNLSRPIPIGRIVKMDQHGLMTMPQMDPNGSKWERGNGSSGISEWYFFKFQKRGFFILGECTWRTKSKTKLPPSRRARSNLVRFGWLFLKNYLFRGSKFDQLTVHYSNPWFQGGCG